MTSNKLWGQSDTITGSISDNRVAYSTGNIYTPSDPAPETLKMNSTIEYSNSTGTSSKLSKQDQYIFELNKQLQSL